MLKNNPEVLKTMPLGYFIINNTCNNKIFLVILHKETR